MSDDDEPSPALARAAGLAIALAGSLAAFGGFALVVLSLVAGGQLFAVGFLLPVLFGVLVARAGRRVFRGHAEDVDFVIAFAVMAAMHFLSLALLTAPMGRLSLLLGGCALPFVVTAIVALAGRPGYRAWRAATERDTR